MINHINRGRSFESAVDAINEGYRLGGLASIERIPTEWTVVGYDARLKRARTVFPKRKSGVDYMGIIKGGFPVVFDAKDTRLKTRFPLDNVHEHQLAFLREKADLGAIAFLLVRLAPLERVFIVSVDTIDAARLEGRASLSLDELQAGIECSVKAGAPDYLEALRRMLKEREGRLRVLEGPQ